MPQLGKAPTTKLVLPSTMVDANGNPVPEDQHVWVEMGTKLYLGDITDIGHILDDDERSITSLTRFIKAWNVTEEDGSPAPIDEAHVRLLDVNDFDWLGEWLAKETGQSLKGLGAEEKKDSTVSSTEETDQTPTPQPVISSSSE